MVFSSENQKRKRVRNLRSVFLAAAAMALVLSVSGTSMPMAAAVTDVVLDYGFGCGDRNWGIKNHQNEQTGYNFFGKDDDCSTVLNTYYGRSNVAKFRVAILGGDDPQYDIAWQAALQGEDPWGWSDQDGGAVYHNTNFPASSTPNYNLKVQWLWSDDVSPGSSTSNVYGNYLTNLWFKNGNKILVIDFLWDRVKNSAGTWAQDSPIADSDTGASGKQYYDPYCKKEGTFDVYHFPVVMEDVNNAKETWREISTNINDEINWAFSFSGYGTGQGCASGSPGARSGYSIVDIETGIELQIFTAGHTGRLEGGYSFSELWY